MYILNIGRAIKKTSVNKIRAFIFENCYKRIGFSKENSYYSMKCLKKDLLLLANKFVKNTSENLNNVDIKSVITEHPKTSHKLTKTI